MKNWRWWVALLVLGLAAIPVHSFQRGLAAIPLRQPLRTIPQKIGDWRGVDVPLETSILKVAGVDDYLNRNYGSSSGLALNLYVGYYMSQSMDDKMHSPKNCLPSAGWQPTNASVVRLASPYGPVPVNVYVVQQAGDRQVVVYWYQSHGRIVANEYWARLYMVADALRANRTDGALVRIVVPVRAKEAQAREQALQFAGLMLPEFDRVFPK